VTIGERQQIKKKSAYQLKSKEEYGLEVKKKKKKKNKKKKKKKKKKTLIFASLLEHKKYLEK
jgi:hypothetical protein